MRWWILALALCAACKGNAAKQQAAKGSDAAAVAIVEDAAAPPVDAAAAKPARPEHSAWNLVDNRHTAHRGVAGELVLDATNASFARYTHFGVPVDRWHLGGKIDNERAALADRTATLDVPIIPEQAPPTQITARVNAADKKQTLVVKVNGQIASKKAKIPLEVGWQTIAIPVDAGKLAPGENQVALETTGKSKKKIAFSWLRFGATHPAADEDPLAAATFDVKTDALELAEGASLTWYVTIPEGAHLVGEVAGECHVEVGLRSGEGNLLGGMLGSDQDRVDLSAMGGKVVRLSLTARDCPRARIVHPRVTLHGPEPEALPKAEPPKLIVLWVMDSLRADKIPIFTPGARAQTPSFDELAKSSAVFRQYYVQGNESQTSHSSVWTGLYPAVHGVRLAGQGGTYKIENDLDVLADQLKKAGYYTIGVTANGFINGDGGYTRGFNEFRNMMREQGPIVIYAEKVLAAVYERLEKHRDAPAFVFMGTIDNHYPWIARKPWIDQYSKNYKGPFKVYPTPQDLGFQPNSMGCHKTPEPEDIERMRAIYDSDVSYMDQQLGTFIEKLKSWNVWDQTMLIVTADHGEEFFEDGRCGHGGSLRDSLIRVPLLIHDPSRFPGGTIVEEGAEGVDLKPTILGAIGLQPAPTVQGHSLAPLAQGFGRGWPTPSYASMYEYAHAMRIGRWKLRVGATGIPIVEDLVDDPDEKKDFSGVRPIERRMLTDNLGLFLALREQWKKASWGPVTNLTADGAAAIDEATAP
jgi:choline-sulfatase